jgi:release factor glutamine methyltransferase
MMRDRKSIVSGAGLSIRLAVADAARLLDGISETPRLDAELLMAHTLGVAREALILRHLDDAVPDAFAALIARRSAHEPLAYLMGWRDFWTIQLKVGPGVLIPRPDSETLIEAAIDHFADGVGPQSILDLGTGPGTLLLSALSEWPEARGLGIDASDIALNYARANAEALGQTGRVAFQFGDWATGLDGPFDLILCNPPYVETSAALARQVFDHEPHEALFAGSDGLDAYRLLAPQFAPLLTAGGCVALEIGAGQSASVSGLMVAQGFTVTTHVDLGGHIRCLRLTKG